MYLPYAAKRVSFRQSHHIVKSTQTSRLRDIRNFEFEVFEFAEKRWNVISDEGDWWMNARFYTWH